MEQIFISSVQKELQAERYAIRDFVHGNDLLRQFFRVFLFEDLPPADRRADAVYLDEVKSSAIYVGVFGNEYGWTGDSGQSPTKSTVHLRNSTVSRPRSWISSSTTTSDTAWAVRWRIDRVRDCEVNNA